MNKDRRAEVAKIKQSLDELRDSLNNTLEAEQDAYENLPDSLKEGEKGELMSTAIDNMTEAIGSIESAMEYLEEAGNV